jgi:predicted DNA-binding transcriptional regulator AlpA
LYSVAEQKREDHMESTSRVLLVDEIASLMRVARSSIYRWLGERRKGIGSFPLPISQAGGKLRWLASDIDSYLSAQASATPVPPTARQRKRSTKVFTERQNTVDRHLEKYRGAKAKAEA